MTKITKLMKKDDFEFQQSAFERVTGCEIFLQISHVLDFMSTL